MPQAEALAMLPTLTTVDEDLDADRAALEQLALWAQQFSPTVGLEETIAPSSLYADETGIAAGFGGEDALLQHVRQEFHAQGWQIRVALADTVGAAWALVHYGEPLTTLPIAALRISDAVVALLAQLGIERIEQLIALPRAQVVERFGPEVILRLDQACGHAAELIEPFRAVPEATASRSFDDPLEQFEAIAKTCDDLLERLEILLEPRQHGIRLLEGMLYQEGFGTARFACSVSRPTRSAGYLGKLLRVHLEKVRLQAPVQGICLRVAVTERMPHEQMELFDHGEAADRTAFTQLLDELTSRLGSEAITQARFVADPQPELACRFDSAVAATEIVDDDVGRHQRRAFEHRPLRLFPEPIPIDVVAVAPEGRPLRFHHDGAEHVIQRTRGPERIETGWWRGHDVQRDYFMVETAAGTRWWLFRRWDDGRWFLHGCFD